MQLGLSADQITGLAWLLWRQSNASGDDKKSENPLFHDLTENVLELYAHMHTHAHTQIDFTTGVVAYLPLSS